MTCCAGLQRLHFQRFVQDLRCGAAQRSPLSGPRTSTPYQIKNKRVKREKSSVDSTLWNLSGGAAERVADVGDVRVLQKRPLAQ